MTWQKSDVTTILKEYPCDGEEPFYQFPTKEWKDKFKMYKEEMLKEKNVFFLGRLAEYRYYNMDAVVKERFGFIKKSDMRVIKQNILLWRENGQFIYCNTGI